MNDELQRHLDSLARDDCYRVDALLKDGELERTERVYFVGANGSEQGPYVRKFFDCESGLGGAYRRILEAQRAGERFLHLPRIIDCYCVGERDAVVMEFIPGRTLADEVYECDPSVELTVRLFPQVCEAVRELHERFNPPLIHRDIKPSNFMVSGSSVFIIDLGIARTFDADASTDTSHFGTRAYAPPEQFGYGQTDVRSDVYALGMLLFYLLCEETPVIGQVEETLIAHDVPPALRNVVSQAASFDPAHRFQSVTALEAAFRAAVESSEEEPVLTEVRDDEADAAFPLEHPSSESDASDCESPAVPSAALTGVTGQISSSSITSTVAATHSALAERGSDSTLRSAQISLSEKLDTMRKKLTTPAFPSLSSFLERARLAMAKFRPAAERPAFAVQAHRSRGLLSWVPFSVGVVWDIVLLLYLLFIAAMCTFSVFFGVVEGYESLPLSVKAVEFAYVWVLLVWPVPLLLDSRPVRRLYPRFGAFRLRTRLIVSITMLVVSVVGICLIGNVVLPYYVVGS